METTTQQQPMGWLRRWLHDVPAFFVHPVEIFRNYKRSDLTPDLLAGVTVAFVMLPQAIAYALIAELPPQTGLYAAIVASIIGALWGSSWHLHTGPTNAASLLVLSTLAPVLVAGSAEYVAAAALMAFLVGILRLLMGLARLGALVNFVADSVIVGFTAGAGILIGVNQLRHLLRLPIPSSPVFLETLWDIVRQSPQTHLLSFGLGVLTIVLIVGIKRFAPKLPATLISIIVISGLVAIFRIDQQGVIVLGELPRTLPPFNPPTFDYALIREIITGVLAVSLIGLIEAMSIARSIAAQSGQRLDSDQEFVGQGLANIATGLFSGFPTSGSFTRSAINFSADGKTPLAVVFSGLFVLVMMLVFAPFAAFLPRTALAGIILVTAYNMINRAEMRRIQKISLGDTVIMYGTLLATLLLPLEFAVLTGILIAFGRYIARSSTPEVLSVVPDGGFEHLRYQPTKPVCPQLAVVTIGGSLYFGATSHVEEEIRANMLAHPEQNYLLLRMHRINWCDVSGVNMLETLLRLYQKRGGGIFLTGVRRDVLDKLRASGFLDKLGEGHVLPQERAIYHIFHKTLDPARCIYHCPVRVWNECQTLPKAACGCALPPMKTTVAVESISAESLHAQLESPTPPLIYDVRESAEFTQGHIEHAKLLPLPDILTNKTPDWNGQPIVLTCRTGRRSARAAQAIYDQSGKRVQILEGGMFAWEAAGLAEVIE